MASIYDIYRSYLNSGNWSHFMTLIDENPQLNRYLFTNTGKDFAIQTFVKISSEATEEDSYKSAMHEIAGQADTEVLRWIISKSSSPTDLNLVFENKTPIEWALLNNKRENAELLAEYIKEPSHKLIDLACENRMWKTVYKWLESSACSQYLFQRVAEKPSSLSPFDHILLYTDVNVLKLILSKCAQPIPFTMSYSASSNNLLEKVNNAKKLDLLIEYGALPDFSALHTWCAKKLWKPVYRTLKFSENFDVKLCFVGPPYKSSPLHFIAGNADTELLDLVLSKTQGSNVDIINEHNETPLCWAVDRESSANVNRLLENNANPNSTLGDGRYSVLDIAIGNGDKEKITLLLQFGATLYSASNPEQQTMSTLQSLRSPLRGKAFRLLNEAAVGGDKIFIHQLLAGNLIDLTNFNLHDVAVHADTEILQLFLDDVTCNIDKLDEEGSTALHGAVLFSPVETIEALLKAGAEPDVLNDSGNTPLGLVVYYNKLHKVRALLKAGAKDCRFNGKDLHFISRDGEYMLHEAAKRGDKEMLQILLNYVSPDQINLENETALQVTKHPQIKQILTDVKADSNDSEYDDEVVDLKRLEEILKLNPDVLQVVVNSLKKKYEEDMENVKQKCDQEIEKLQTTLSSMKEKHSEEINDMTASYKNDIAKLRKEINALKIVTLENC